MCLVLCLMIKIITIHFVPALKDNEISFRQQESSIVLEDPSLLSSRDFNKKTDNTQETSFLFWLLILWMQHQTFWKNCHTLLKEMVKNISDFLMKWCSWCFQSDVRLNVVQYSCGVNEEWNEMTSVCLNGVSFASLLTWCYYMFHGYFPHQF